MTRPEQAEKLFREGYNCAQAAFLPFAEECGLSRETAAALASSFGGGMGRLREVCGAVSGIFLAAGLLCGYSDPKDPVAKKAHYELIQRLAARYREENGSIVCRELLGLPAGPDSPTPEARTGTYYKKRPCPELVRRAAEIPVSYTHLDVYKRQPFSLRR